MIQLQAKRMAEKRLCKCKKVLLSKIGMEPFLPAAKALIPDRTKLFCFDQ